MVENIYLQARTTYEEEKQNFDSESMSSTVLERDTILHKEHAHGYHKPYTQVKSFGVTVIPSV